MAGAHERVRTLNVCAGSGDAGVFSHRGGRAARCLFSGWSGGASSCCSGMAPKQIMLANGPEFTG